MKRQILANGLLSLTAVTVMTGCVDDKYDLTDIDTTSRFTVDNLTVPVRISEIKLENVIDFDDDDPDALVKTENGQYVIKRGGEISPTSFDIAGVHVNAPHINATNLSVNIPGASGVTVPDFTFPAIELPASDKTPYSFDMQNIDEALKVLCGIKTVQPLTVEVVLSVPAELAKAGNSITFRNLEIQLPWGLEGVGEGYDPATGLYKVAEVAVATDGKARLPIAATGLQLGDKGNITDRHLAVAGEVGIIGGEILISVIDTNVPSTLDIHADYNVASFDLASISGKIEYRMDDIKIDPITLNDLPDFLDNPQTNLIIAQPQILVSIKNPVGNWIDGKGKISLTSNFKNGSQTTKTSSEFTLTGNQSDFAFCTKKTGYTYVEFDGLRNVLSDGYNGLPSSIEVGIQDIKFEGEVTDFPLGNLGSTEGDYEFNAPLGFGAGSVVVYETTVDGWSSDTLDDVNITSINLNAVCSTDLPVAVQLTVTPIDKNGREIPVKEESGLFSVPAKANGRPVALVIESQGGPIKNLDGVKFRATVTQENPENDNPLGPNLKIVFDDIRVSVNGYYETDF